LASSERFATSPSSWFRRTSRGPPNRASDFELHVSREVNDSHVAAAELALAGILTGECGLEIEEFSGCLRQMGSTNLVVRAFPFLLSCPNPVLSAGR
jgi:hypothetical protein